MNQRNHYSRKKRHLAVLAKRLQFLLSQQKEEFVVEIDKLILKIKHLIQELSAVLSKPVLVKALGATAFLFGISFASQSQAQSFKAPVQNPFGITSVSDFGDPSFVDLDDDGDLDLLVGEYYGAIKYFENNGTTTSPSYKAPLTNPFGLDTVNTLAFIAVADLDNDGDADVLVGEYGGNFKYFKNIGTASSPNFSAAQTNPFGLTATSGFAIPEFVDLDNDGDMDLLVGEYYGAMKYYENTGSATSPQFASPTTNPFGLVSTYMIAAPTFADLDNDGDFDLLVGEYYGAMKYFKNTGTASNPQFAAPVINPFGIDSAYAYGFPTFADLDGDGDFDLLYGEYYGNFQYFENLTTSPGFEGNKQDYKLLLYPNPAHEFLNIETDMPIEKIEILNTLGKTVISTRNTKQISLSNLAAGFYTARITSPKGDYFIQKFVKK